MSPIVIFPLFSRRSFTSRYLAFSSPLASVRIFLLGTTALAGFHFFFVGIFRLLLFSASQDFILL
jgi:hypothetical protein